MRRLVVALIVLSMAVMLTLSLTGCGGGDAETPAAEDAPVVAAAPLVDVDPVPDLSAEESATFVPFPEGEDVPTTVAERLASGRPMLLLFQDDMQLDDDDLRAEVNRVVKNNSGMVDLLTYDIGKYSSVNDSGAVEVDSAKLDASSAAQESVNLARLVGVTFAPYVVIVDDQGYIIFRHSGYIDSTLLERQILRVSE